MTPFEKEAREIVAKLKKNVALHVEEWDETRYLERAIAKALSHAYRQGQERMSEPYQHRIFWVGFILGVILSRPIHIEPMTHELWKILKEALTNKAGG